MEREAGIEQAHRRHAASSHRNKDGDREDDGPESEHVRDAEVRSIHRAAAAARTSRADGPVIFAIT